MERDGTPCNCGRRGCLETKVSYSAMASKRPFALKEFGDAYRKAKEEGAAEFFDEAIDLFARTIVNSTTILAPNRVVLCGKLFSDEEIRKRLIANCMEYDASCNENRIIYSSLAGEEDYIGAVASFVQTVLF